jgi:hypothetical protein
VAVFTALSARPQARLATLLALLIGVVALTVVLARPTPPVRMIMLHPVSPLFAPSDLLSNAEAIVLADFQETLRASWNSLDGREWTSSSPSRPAFIYSDDRLRFAATLRGPNANTVDVRTVGGVVGDVEMVLDNQPHWRSGQRYLLFLRQEDTPLQDGVERRWTVLWSEQGVFEPDGGGDWINRATGVVISDAQLASIE